MKFNELFSSSNTSITLKCKKPYFDDDYLDSGMFCILIGTTIEKRDQNLIWLHLDLEMFAEYNKKFEQANYWDKNGHPTLTATQAGFAPPFNARAPWVTKLCVIGDQEIDEWFTIIE
jgi:hypothetical protein